MTTKDTMIFHSEDARENAETAALTFATSSDFEGFRNALIDGGVALSDFGEALSRIQFEEDGSVGFEPYDLDESQSYLEDVYDSWNEENS